jgi:hypothetical protein
MIDTSFHGKKVKRFAYQLYVEGMCAMVVDVNVLQRQRVILWCWCNKDMRAVYRAYNPW